MFRPVRRRQSPAANGEKRNRPLTVIEIDPASLGTSGGNTGGGANSGGGSSGEGGGGDGADLEPGPPVIHDPLDNVIAVVTPVDPVHRRATMLYQLARASRSVISRFSTLLAEGRVSECARRSTS